MPRSYCCPPRARATVPSPKGSGSPQVITQCKRRHRHQEFLQFLRHLDAEVPHELDLHLIVDNYATDKHAKVKLWLAKRPRYHIHYTPTYSSWLNQMVPYYHSAGYPPRNLPQRS